MEKHIKFDIFYWKCLIIMLQRKIEKALNSYYSNITAPIPIITGARQIGKTFIIRQTACKYFKHYVEINLKEDYENQQLFASIKTTQDFYLQISALYGQNLHDINDTIIFLDEIQTYPHLISLLKPLKQENRFRYISSGSLLGITLKHIFIPMGSIQEIHMFPLDFEEFLWANGTGRDVIDYLKECFISKKQVSDSIHKTMLRRFKEYLISGGLPASVNEMIKQDIYLVRTIQSNIFSFYKDDASQYDREHNLKIRRIYDYLPSYIENKVKRIKFKNIEGIKNSNLTYYQDEFDYLISSGCAIGVKACSNPIFPLNESMSKNLIKLYYNDVGILSNILYKNNINAILNDDNAVNIGAVYETAAAMEINSHGHELYYFDSKKVGEVDFLINDYENLNITPIEIKSGKHQNIFRAIPKLVDKTGPYKLRKGYIFVNQNIMKEENDLITFPIYMIMFI